MSSEMTWSSQHWWVELMFLLLASFAWTLLSAINSWIWKTNKQTSTRMFFVFCSMILTHRPLWCWWPLGTGVSTCLQGAGGHRVLVSQPVTRVLVSTGYWCLNLSPGCWWLSLGLSPGCWCPQGAGVSTCHQGAGVHRVLVSQPVTRVLVAQPRPVSRVLVSTGCWCPQGAGVSTCDQGAGGHRVLVSQPVTRVLVATGYWSLNLSPGCWWLSLSLSPGCWCPQGAGVSTCDQGAGGHRVLVSQPVTRVLVATGCWCLSLSPGYWWLSLGLSPGYWGHASACLQGTGGSASACLQGTGDSVSACLQGTGGMPQPVSRVLVACLSLSPGCGSASAYLQDTGESSCHHYAGSLACHLGWE